MYFAVLNATGGRTDALPPFTEWSRAGSKYKGDNDVVQGFRQRSGIDYCLTYAPVANATVVRVALAIGAYLDLDIKHIDFTQAFLNASLDEDLYVTPPPGAPQIMLVLYVDDLLKWHLGIHYERDRAKKQIFCSQEQAIDSLTKDDCLEEPDEEVGTWYLKVVGSL